MFIFYFEELAHVSKDDEEDLFMEHEAREEVEEQHNKKTVVGSPADKELIETLQRENQELRANIEKLQEALSKLESQSHQNGGLLSKSKVNLPG